MNRAIFLDRDGVILIDKDLREIGLPGPEILRPEDAQLYADVPETLKLLASTDYKIIVVTNQSKVGRGLLTEDDLKKINQKMVREIEGHGGRIEQVYYCPHKPEDNCTCRKPNTGMFEQAKKDYDIRIEESFWVSDTARDMTVNLPFKKKFLVKTGYAGRDGTIPKDATVVNTLIDFAKSITEP